MFTNCLRFVLMFLIFCVGTASCDNASDPILSSECRPPCWNEITPGITASKDAILKLSKHPKIDQETINVFSASQFIFTDGIEWDFQDGRKGALFLDNNIVMELEFRSTNYRLAKLVKSFGEPDQFVLSPYNGQTITINLIYDHGILLSYEDKINSNFQVVIDPKDKVTTIVFYNPSVKQEIIEEITYIRRIYYKETEDELVKNWAGYGIVLYR